VGIPVTFGAYFYILEVLNMALVVGSEPGNMRDQPAPQGEGLIPVCITLANYPQLQRLAWQVSAAESLCPVKLWIFMSVFRAILMSQRLMNKSCG